MSEQTDDHGRQVSPADEPGSYLVTDADGLSMTVSAPTPEAALATINAMPPYSAPKVEIPRQIDPMGFINRFDMGEQQKITEAAAANWQVSLWLTKCLATASIDVTHKATQDGLAALVAAGLLSGKRAAQILDLSIASP